MNTETKMPAWLAKAFADAIPGPTALPDTVSSTASDSDEPSTESANSHEDPADTVEIDAAEFDEDREAAVRAEIEVALVASGLTARELALAVARVECVFSEHTMGAAAEGLAVVLATLGKSPMGEAIRRRLTHDDRPLRDAAGRIGCSAEGLRKAEAKLAEALKGS